MVYFERRKKSWSVVSDGEKGERETAKKATTVNFWSMSLSCTMQAHHPGD